MRAARGAVLASLALMVLYAPALKACYPGGVDCFGLKERLAETIQMVQEIQALQRDGLLRERILQEGGHLPADDSDADQAQLVAPGTVSIPVLTGVQSVDRRE